MLQALYDAVHAAALSLAGATNLLHEAVVDVVTVPNLGEHLSSAETTEQLSAHFAYATAMKSMNNLLLLGEPVRHVEDRRSAQGQGTGDGWILISPQAHDPRTIPEVTHGRPDA